MHYYVLFCQSLKIDKLYQIFNNQKNIEAFIPKMEKHIHSKNILVLKPMFPGYLFIKTTYNQIKFDTLLTLMYEQKDGVIRELKKEDVSALTKDEIQLLKVLLNKNYILETSYGYKENGRTVVTKGPLVKLQDHIISVDKRDHLAILNIEFLDREIKAGIEMQNKEI